MLLCLSSVVGCGGYPISVHVHEKHEYYNLHVPVSKLAISIPKNGFVQKEVRIDGGTENPRYFYFFDNKTNTIISGWFESEEQFNGVNVAYEPVKKDYIQRRLSPQNEQFDNIGKWNSISYDLNDSGNTFSHMHAHWVQAGTWIELHLSIPKNTSNDQARSQLIALLQTIKVYEY